MLKINVLEFEQKILDESIPSNIGSLQSLQVLDVSQNLLVGEIPQKLGGMKQLEKLNLSGSILSTFDEIASLASTNRSYNELEGPIPNIKAFRLTPIATLQNKRDLCGIAVDLKACSKLIPTPLLKRSNRLLVIILLSLLGTLFIIFVIIGVSYLFCRRV